MIKMTLCILAIVLTACGVTSSQSINSTSDAKVKPSNVKPVSSATPSDCVKKRTYGLESNINIPDYLCVDTKQPIDRSEDVRTNKRLVGNTLSSEYDIPFGKLPPEVQNIVRLTTGEQFTRENFTLHVIPGDDESKPESRSVKTYRYGSSGEVSWDFMRQSKKLKLNAAQFKNPPTTEEPYLKTFTLMCSRRRAYMLEPDAPKPDIPLDLCFDDRRSVDAGEIIVGKPKKMLNDVTLSEESGIPFDKLPPEVQQVIRLTSGEKYVNKKFHLDVMIDYTDGEGSYARKKTKDYLYHPGAELNDNPSWAFKRQDNQLKLTQAMLAIER